MPDRRLQAWLLAMTRFEFQYRPVAAILRNAYILAAEQSYTANGTVAGWLRTAHEKRIEMALVEHYQAVLPRFADMAMAQVKSRRVERKQADHIVLMSEWIKREALRKAKLIAATDSEHVRSALQDGIEEGLGTEAIARNIRKVSNQTPTRAATIARTETHAAATYGSIESVRQAEQELGIKMLKLWLPTMDDQTREDHRAMQYHPPIPLDEKFSVGGEMMDRPGDPGASAEQVIACRCAIAYEEAE